MTFSRSMLAMMPRTISVNVFSALSTDGYGARTYSTGTTHTVSCYIEDKVVLVRDVLGRESQSTRQVYCAPFNSLKAELRVGPSDKITLPTGYSPQTPPIVNVTHYDDRDGFYGQVLYI